MSLSPARTVFGIHSISPYRLLDAVPYGTLKVLGGGNLELTGETEKLYGGSSKYPFASEQTQISSSMTANVKSYEDFMMELFLGGSVTAIAAAASGEVVNEANLNGESVIDSSTGIATIDVKSGSEADLKFGRYVVKAVDADTVDVYLLADVDFAKGQKGEFLTDDLKVAAAIDIVASTAAEVSKYGVELTGGSGTIGMTAGDTAIFDVYPPHSGGSYIEVGSSTAEFSNFGAFMIAQKKTTKDIFQIHAYNCIGSGMPINLQEKTWAISDLTVDLLRDETKDAIFSITALREI